MYVCVLCITKYSDTQNMTMHLCFCVIFQDPLAGRSIFSGSLFQYLEENRKWRNRFVSVPNSYTISLFESKTVSARLNSTQQQSDPVIWALVLKQLAVFAVSPIGTRPEASPESDHQLRWVQGPDLNGGIHGAD